MGGTPGAAPYHGIQGGVPLVWAHRGSSAEAPENTLASFRLASIQGADGIECDVRLCASGEAVVVHDERLDRLIGVPLAVRDLPLSGLRLLRVLDKAFPGFDQGIPTLEEAVTSVGQAMRWNIELKVARHQEAEPLANEVVSVVRRLGIEERVLLSSFHPMALLTCRTLAPEIPTAYLWEPGGAHLMGWHGFLRRLCATAAVHPHVSVVTRERVERWHRKGWAVNTWVADDPGDIRGLARMGVDGIITNRPNVARHALERV